jgi:enoyl-CoA hydratase/carnithine racemase
VRLEHDGPLCTVVLDRPERRNAQTPATWRALTAAAAALPPVVRVVVLRGEGPSFSAGMDTAMLDPPDKSGRRGPPRSPGAEPSLLDLAGLAEDDLDATIAGFQQAFTCWRAFGVVSIAAVQGHAVGAGVQLALGADLRVLADDAALCMREPSLGLVPDLGGTKPLVDLVGYPRALEICLTGRWVRAEEAARLGLAELVVARSELADATADLVAALLGAPAGAAAETVELLRSAGSRSPVEQLAAERAAQGRRIRALAAGDDAPVGAPAVPSGR